MTVLGWFLDAAGIDSARREEMLEPAVAGRFDSWVEPPRAVVESVAEDLARRVTVDHARSPGGVAAVAGYRRMARWRPAPRGTGAGDP